MNVPVWFGEGHPLGCRLQVPLHGGRDRRALLDSFYRSVNLFHEGSALKTLSSPKDPTTNTITFGVRILTYKFGGTQTQYSS